MGPCAKDRRSYWLSRILGTESRIHYQEQLFVQYRTEVPQGAGRCESVVLIRVVFHDGFNPLAEIVPLLF